MLHRPMILSKYYTQGSGMISVVQGKSLLVEGTNTFPGRGILIIRLAKALQTEKGLFRGSGTQLNGFQRPMHEFPTFSNNFDPKDGDANIATKRKKK